MRSILSRKPSLPISLALVERARDSSVGFPKGDALRYCELVGAFRRVELWIQSDVLRTEGYASKRISHDSQRVLREIHDSEQRRLEPLQISLITGIELCVRECSSCQLLDSLVRLRIVVR